jgi:TolB-like protein
MEATECQIGHLVLQPHRQLLDGGQRLAVGSKALALLSALAEAKGGLLTKDELMAAAWPGVIVEENAIQVHIAALRKLMGEAADALVTVRGVGYRLNLVPNGHAGDARITPTPTETTLAVLPFDNLSSDAEMGYFSDGVSEEILGHIARTSSLKVIGRTSSFQFRGNEKAQAAAQLGATHILDGSIQRAADRVRISANLLDATTLATLWSDHFDRDLKDIFAVQDEIAAAIADALNASFFPIGAAPVKPAAYDLYLRAKERVTSVEQMERNVASLEHVVKIAPNFAGGWGTLAYRRAELMMHSPYPARAALRADVETELANCGALDPGHPDALAASWLQLPPFGCFAAQEAAFASNAHSDTESVDLMTDRAYFLECVGCGEEAAALAGEAVALDALNPYAVGIHGQALWRAGHFAEGRAVLEHVREKWPDSHHSVAVLIQACIHAQDWEMVERLTNPARLALYPLREHQGVAAFGRVMHEAGNRGRRLMFDTICKRADASGHMDAQVAVIAAELGFVEETYALLDRCRFGPAGVEEDVMGMHAYRTLLLFSRAYTALRADRRFVQLCARLGLVEYWLETQNWPDCAREVPYDFKSECESACSVPRDTYRY